MTKANLGIRFGFTLAEVLITLGIIGVVAALTIPSLMNNINNKELETGFLKNYSMLKQASIQMTQEQGGEVSNAYTSSTQMFNALANQLKVEKTCTSTNAIGTCWASKVKNLTKDISDLYAAESTDFAFNTDTMILVNGVAIQVNSTWYTADCSGTWYKKNNEPGYCAIILIDINGLKGPNIFGRDIYSMYFTKKDGIIPDGIPETDDYGSGDWGYCNNTGSGVYNGIACAGRIIVENGMKY